MVWVFFAVSSSPVFWKSPQCGVPTMLWTVHRKLWEENTAIAMQDFISRRSLTRGSCPSLSTFCVLVPKCEWARAARGSWQPLGVLPCLLYTCNTSYTELLVAYSRWQLRTMGLAVWSTLLQKTKRQPGLFVGDCVQSSGTCTCCSLYFLPLKCLTPVSRRQPPCCVQFQSCHGWGKGGHKLVNVILILLI